ncbi:MAG: hypothetical protein HY287_15600 [Planctomycetes bacterium]|nr:hypothetical protein [Planctomycetota bacterium]MBI3835750.1 hypothetical protein [Planctomycetota bacterium]
MQKQLQDSDMWMIYREENKQTAVWQRSVVWAFGLLAATLSASAFGGVVAGTGHEEDTVIGHNAAGQLETIIGSPGLNELPPVNSFLHGWANDEPGNKTPAEDNPANDFFTLAPGAIINLRLVSIDPGFKVWSPGFTTALTTPGSSFILGGSDFDTHGTFHIDSTNPNFDPNKTDYAVTFRVVDTGTTGYAESAPFTLHFTPVPEPMTLAMLSFGAVATIGRGLRNSHKGSSI